MTVRGKKGDTAEKFNNRRNLHRVCHIEVPPTLYGAYGLESERKSLPCVNREDLRVDFLLKNARNAEDVLPAVSMQT